MSTSLRGSTFVARRRDPNWEMRRREERSSDSEWVMAPFAHVLLLSTHCPTRCFICSICSSCSSCSRTYGSRIPSPRLGSVLSTTAASTTDGLSDSDDDDHDASNTEDNHPAPTYAATEPQTPSLVSGTGIVQPLQLSPSLFPSTEPTSSPSKHPCKSCEFCSWFGECPDRCAGVAQADSRAPTLGNHAMAVRTFKRIARCPSSCANTPWLHNCTKRSAQLYATRANQFFATELPTLSSA